MTMSKFLTYPDPEKGEIQQLPDFSQPIIHFESAELEALIEDGKVSRTLYESYKQYCNRSRELIGVFDSTKECIDLDVSFNSNDEFINCILLNKGFLLKERAYSAEFNGLKDDYLDIMWLRCIKNAITNSVSKDLLPIHIHVAEQLLKRKYEICDPQASNILARLLMEYLEEVGQFRALNHPVLTQLHPEPQDIIDHLASAKGEVLALDAEFLTLLKRIGRRGSVLSQKAWEDSKKLYSEYKNNNYLSLYRSRLWGLWVPCKDTQGKYESFSFGIELLCRALWEDIGKSVWTRVQKEVPALEKKVVIDVIKPLMSTTTKKIVKQVDDKIICCDKDGATLLYVPAVGIDVIEMLKRGMKSLSSLTGHRILRWEVKLGFDQWCQGSKDPRLIVVDGGYSAIAKLAGCSSSHDVAKVKAILQAQAMGVLVYPDHSYGNLIALNVQERYRNTEPSRIEITLGSVLFPGFIFRINKHEGRRLIPFGDLPPLYGANNTHTYQAQLQLLVFEEFSNQSNRIALQGSAHIPPHKWDQMAREAGLKPTHLEKVIAHWCQPDLFNRFLDRHGDEYSLSSYYEKTQRFLVNQGERRVDASRRGKASVASKQRGRAKLF